MIQILPAILAAFLSAISPVQSEPAVLEVPDSALTVVEAQVERIEDNDIAVLEIAVDSGEGWEIWSQDIPAASLNEPAIPGLVIPVYREPVTATFQFVSDGILYTGFSSESGVKWCLEDYCLDNLGCEIELGSEYVIFYGDNWTEHDETDEGSVTDDIFLYIERV